MKSDSLTLWQSVPSDFPKLDNCYTIDQQLQKEAEVDRLMHDVDVSLERLKASGRAVRRETAEVRSRIQRSIVQLLHTFDCVIDIEMEQSFSKVIDEFIERAYEFDPQIGDEAIYQASRNVLIMNTFQMHLEKEITLTPSVFAYSMLYPYTDNYLDSIGISSHSKHDWNEWLLLRLSGIAVTPRNLRERIINRLVEMIETEYDRGVYTNVYESLLAIHKAQTRSVAQQCDNLSDAELLDVSVEKGGTSVLADGYLVAGELSASDAEFFYRFGILLQLIDDLQDLQEDRSRRHQTLAGCAAENGELDGFTNRLLSFAASVLKPALHNQQKLCTLIERSCRLLILEAIASNHSYYSDHYILTMERYSPVRFDYLRSINRKLKERHGTNRVKELRKYRHFSRRVKEGIFV
ncbi:MAG: hypothetical protein HY800_06515 [Ignavibacteriales bacterium]|nr:hypothetical protein [Ignavibacteriales bacterium]